MSGAFQKQWKQQRRPQISERSLQSQVFDFFRVALPADAVPFAIPNGDGKVTTMPGALPGFPDIGILYQKRLVLIELKTKTGVVEDHQHEVHARLALAGGLVAVCRSVEEVRDVLALVMPLRARLDA